MKKLTALLLALIMLLSLCACGSTQSTPAPAAEAPQSNESAPEQAPAAEPEAAPQPTVDFPKKPLTIIVPYSAGGSCDLTTRQLAVLMEKELGQSITVVNQGGSSGAIGIQACLDADPDGYTMVVTADSLGTLRVMGLSDSISYDDFAPISAIINDPKTIVVGKDSPYNTLEDLFNDMAARPGKVKMSYTGPGGSGHVQSLILNAMGYDMALTAYSGGSDSLLAVLNNSVDFTNANYSTVIDHLASGNLKCLAVCATDRIAALPDVPAITELYPEAESYLRFPFCPYILQVRNDVDPQIVEILRDAAAKAMATDEWKNYVEETCQEKLYEKYPTQEDVYSFMKGFESLVSWMLYDAGVTQFSPEDFDIARP